MKIDTTLFGEVDIQDEEIITFPKGIIGFSDCTRFVFIQDNQINFFQRLQSLDNSSVCFVVADPLIIRPDYVFRVSLDDLKFLKTNTEENILVYCIVTMAEDVHEVTVNLKEPILINTKNNLGYQFVLLKENYKTNEKLIQNFGFFG